MSRHKKTRQQKKRSDIRRQATPVQSPAVSTSPTFQYTGHQSIAKRTIHTPSNTAAIPTNPHVIHDLRKTMLVTASVVFAEMVLYLLLQNHIIQLPFIQF